MFSCQFILISDTSFTDCALLSQWQRHRLHSVYVAWSSYKKKQTLNSNMEKNRDQFIRTVLTSLSLYQLKRSSRNWLTIIKYLRCTQQAF